MVVMAVALVSCHRPWGCLLLGGIGGGGGGGGRRGGFFGPLLFLFIGSGPGTAGSWASFNWNLGQCLGRNLIMRSASGGDSEV